MLLALTHSRVHSASVLPGIMCFAPHMASLSAPVKVCGVAAIAETETSRTEKYLKTLLTMSGEQSGDTINVKSIVPADK